MLKSSKRLDESLNALFSSFAARASLHKGRYDRDFRKPEVLLGMINAFGVAPRPEYCCLVSGSKGKGSVSRLIAWNLQARGIKCGLITTPEEVNHLDRIRINNEPIPATDFIQIFSDLKPTLDNLLSSSGYDYYFSPTGLFLLVGLFWFKKQKIDVWIIEGGRGVAYDEIGGLEAKIGVLTNVLFEHPARLGPEFNDIVKDKFFLTKNVEKIILDNKTLKCAKTAGIDLSSHRYEIAEPVISPGKFPAWYGNALGFAKKTVPHFCNGDDSLVAWETPAFQFVRGGWCHGAIISNSICCEGVVHPSSLDDTFLISSGLVRGAVVLGLSDDKDFSGILARLRCIGFVNIYAFFLRSPVNHISCNWVTGCSDIIKLAELDVVAGGDDVLAQKLDILSVKHGAVYAIGIQVFIRSIRQAFKKNLVSPYRYLAPKLGRCSEG
jgi:dihydrofolate synthase/folylpolyglutamate synthase